MGGRKLKGFRCVQCIINKQHIFMALPDDGNINQKLLQLHPSSGSQLAFCLPPCFLTPFPSLLPPPPPRMFATIFARIKCTFAPPIALSSPSSPKTRSTPITGTGRSLGISFALGRSGHCYVIPWSCAIRLGPEHQFIIAPTTRISHFKHLICKMYLVYKMYKL